MSPFSNTMPPFSAAKISWLLIWAKSLARVKYWRPLAITVLIQGCALTQPVKPGGSFLLESKSVPSMSRAISLIGMCDTPFQMMLCGIIACGDEKNNWRI